MILILGFRATTTVAETTLPQPEAAKPIATLIIILTPMVSRRPPGHLSKFVSSTLGTAKLVKRELLLQ